MTYDELTMLNAVFHENLETWCSRCPHNDECVEREQFGQPHCRRLAMLATNIEVNQNPDLLELPGEKSEPSKDSAWRETWNDNKQRAISAASFLLENWLDFDIPDNVEPCEIELQSERDNLKQNEVARIIVQVFKKKSGVR